MNTLFPVEPLYPEGFSYTSGFLNEGEEKELYHVIRQTELHNFNFQGFKANRKVASFGYDYSFDNGSLTKGKEIPASFDFVIDKVSRHLSINRSHFAELLVTEYPPGSVINWHRDAPPLI
jgi:hypothetical protein